jgi:hypothetical protein
LFQIQFSQEIWRATSKTCQQVVIQINNNTTQDYNNMVTNGEIQLFPRQIELQNRLFSLKFSAPLIASIIEARQTNSEQRAIQIIEFKKETPKQQSSRFHRTHQHQHH